MRWSGPLALVLVGETVTLVRIRHGFRQMNSGRSSAA
jgi:hypothetical protein